MYVCGPQEVDEMRWTWSVTQHWTQDKCSYCNTHGSTTKFTIDKNVILARTTSIKVQYEYVIQVCILITHDNPNPSSIIALYRYFSTLVCVCVGVWCGVVWCGVVWCGVVWCGVVWCGVVWCGVVWCGVV